MRSARNERADAVAAAIVDRRSWPAIRYRINAALDAGRPALDVAQWPTPSHRRQTVQYHVLRTRVATVERGPTAALVPLEAALRAAEPEQLREAVARGRERGFL